MPYPPPLHASIDDYHCSAACAKMVLEACGQRISWDELDRQLEALPTLSSWTVSVAAVLAEKIPGTKLYSRIDYQRFATEGAAYLAEYWTPQYYSAMTTVASPGFRREQRHAWLLTRSSAFENRALSDAELCKLLDSNYVISVVDIRQLEGQKGISCHAVVLYKHSQQGFHFHDPGLPAAANVTAPREAFVSAMGTAREVIVVPA